VKLASLSTVAAGKAPSVLSLFPGLQSVEPAGAAAAAAKVIRQLHVQGWSCYWKPRRPLAQQQQHQQQQGQVCPGLTVPTIEAHEYLLSPVEAVMQLTVHTSGAGGGGSAAAAASLAAGGVSCELFLGAGQVGMQVSTQQLIGMARLADDAAVWSKRARYGRYRPPGWISVQQAVQQQLPGWQLHSAGQQHSRQGAPSHDAAAAAATASAGSQLVPTGRAGVGAPVSWRQVWQYAVHAVLADLRERRRQQGWRTALKSDVKARR
jgi:hypothetical protein